MPRLKLDVDTLAVESYATALAAEPVADSTTRTNCDFTKTTVCSYCPP